MGVAGATGFRWCRLSCGPLWTRELERGFAEAQPWELLLHGCRAHKKAEDMQAALLQQPSLHPWSLTHVMAQLSLVLFLVEQALECRHPSFHYMCHDDLRSVEGEGGVLRPCHNRRLQSLLAPCLPSGGPAKDHVGTCKPTHIGF